MLCVSVRNMGPSVVAARGGGRDTQPPPSFKAFSRAVQSPLCRLSLVIILAQVNQNGKNVQCTNKEFQVEFRKLHRG